MSVSHPYRGLPGRSYWSSAVSERHASQLSDLFDGIPDLGGAAIATAGSCFAQHIGRAFKARGLRYMDYEPAPPFLSPADADALGYGVYSCRYGNIYTVRQLRQLIEEAFEGRQPVDAVWERDGRFYDALRPGVEQGGFGSESEVRALRAYHLTRVRTLLSYTSLFVFTLGLTEAWVSKRDGTAYPIAPGVMAGRFSADDYAFANFRYSDIYADLAWVIGKLRSIRPACRFLFTVSPVPLAATATGQHVLAATTYSKSVLRAVAGDIAQDFEGVYYFPSYEVITGQPARHAHYNPDLRTVAQAGVNEVMRHFFAGEAAQPVAAAQDSGGRKAASFAPDASAFEHCEEALLDQAR